MSILRLPHARPHSVVFDWHATLADTMDAMYHAVDDVLPKLEALGLIDRLVPTDKSRTVEDAKLVKYVRERRELHPRIKSDRKVSRTDIFEVLFGDDREAKRIAHQEFDACYRNHLGEVKPFEPGIPDMLAELRSRGIRIGILSNRAREYMEHEISVIDGSGWWELIDTLVCGDDVKHRKPHPDLIERALENLGEPADTHCWYVGDSSTDIYAAKAAGVTAVFYNGAGWPDEWIDKIFPGTERHPHQPDVVINHFGDLRQLVREFLSMPREAAVAAPGRRTTS